VTSTEEDKEKKKEKKKEVKETRKTFKQSIGDCKNPDSSDMIAIENYFCDMFVEVINAYRAVNSPDIQEHIERLSQSPEILPLIEKVCFIVFHPSFSCCTDPMIRLDHIRLDLT